MFIIILWTSVSEIMAQRGSDADRTRWSYTRNNLSQKRKCIGPNCSLCSPCKNCGAACRLL